jgi:microcompartment protein CcmL/EutN
MSQGDVMNGHTIGCLELNSVALGIQAADIMVKTAQVSLIMARPTCPGRYLVLVSGDTASVTSAVNAGRHLCPDMVVDWFSIPNVHPEVIPALNGTGVQPRIEALGVIETCSTASCILAADAAAKAAQVSLLEIRCAAGLAGKAFVVMTGDVGSVEAAVQAGILGVGETGPVLSHVVIASPSEDIKAHIV